MTQHIQVRVISSLMFLALVWTFPPLCVDNNECATDPNLCGSNGVCQNTPGSFSCECQRGFSLDSSGQTCEGLKTIDTDLSMSWLITQNRLLQKCFCVFFHWQIWMSVMVTTDVNMVVRTWWVDTGAVVHKGTCSTTSGTSVWVSNTTVLFISKHKNSLLLRHGDDLVAEVCTVQPCCSD